jgi:hypothetical protein
LASLAITPGAVLLLYLKHFFIGFVLLYYFKRSALQIKINLDDDTLDVFPRVVEWWAWLL